MLILKKEYWMVVIGGQGQFAEEIWNRKGILKSSAIESQPWFQSYQIFFKEGGLIISFSWCSFSYDLDLQEN